ncbi:cytochrome c [Sabulicella glaciei]|uniref:Cytochrome c n=1 Tax=Sabulicella glaciei TaxID=2984948 RepID=A0ABT3P138_9PROT|nr:cytochrome c [Roseococcus sp. MDT2-1-1]MCW8087474.1 cytochrome c [Roseococcus sp. MDT2-1-1]
MGKWGIGLVMLGLAAGAALAQTPAQIVQERREGLRRVGATMEAVQQSVQGRGDPTALAPRIAEAHDFFAQGFPARFPTGTQQGTPGLETRALPGIWVDSDGFHRAGQGVVTALANLRDAAASGDRAATATAFQAAGAACGNCHRPFRAPAR